MTPGARASVWTLVTLTGVVFASGGLASKGLIDRGVDAFTITGLPFLVAGGFGWLVAWRAGNVRASALAAGATLGVLNTGMPALFFNLGYETLPAGLVALIVSLGPAVTAAIAHLVFADERFNRLKGIGLLLAFAGVGALVTAPGVIEGASYRGAAWTAAGALVAGSSAVLARWFALRHGALALIAPQLTAGGIIALAAGIALRRPLIPEAGFAGGDVPIMVGVGLFASYTGFRALMLANERGTTGQVAMVAYLIPLLGVAGGIVFFDEALTPWIALGGALILAGIWLGGRASASTAPNDNLDPT